MATDSAITKVPEEPGAAGRIRSLLNGRFIAAIAAFVLAFVYTFVAPVSLVPGQTLSPGSLEYWFTKRETNAWHRYLQVPGEIISVVELDEDHLVLGTTYDRVFVTFDGGRSWTEATGTIGLSAGGNESASADWLRTAVADSGKEAAPRPPPEFEILSAQQPGNAASQQQQQQQGQQEYQQPLQAPPTQSSGTLEEIVVDASYVGVGAFAMSFAGGEGWVLTSDGRVVHSADGGLTWQLRAAMDYPGRSLHFANSSDGWLINWNDELMRSSDGGQTWASVLEDAYGMTASPDGMYVITTDKLFRVPLSGEPEALMALPEFAEFTHILYGPADTLWIADSEDAEEIYRLDAVSGAATNGSWQRVDLSLVVPLHDSNYEFYDLTVEGFAAGYENGVALLIRNHLVRSMDGGETWQVMDTGTTWRDIAWSQRGHFLLAGEGLARVDVESQAVQWQTGGRMGLFVDGHQKEEELIVGGLPALRSTDGGESWRIFNPDLLTVQDVYRGSDNTRYCLTTTGLFSCNEFQEASLLQGFSFTTPSPARLILHDATNWAAVALDWVVSSYGGGPETELDSDFEEELFLDLDVFFLANNQWLVALEGDAGPTSFVDYGDGEYELDEPSDTYDGYALSAGRDVTGLIWVLDEDGLVAVSTDNGFSFQVVGRVYLPEEVLETQVRIRAAHNSLFVFSVSAPWMQKSDDGGRSWQSVDVTTGFEDLRGLPGGDIIRTSQGMMLEVSKDGGSSWQVAGTYEQSAPPFSWLLLTVGGAFLLTFIRRQPPARDPLESIPQGANDAPATSVEADTLNRANTVLAMSRLIRNPGTQFPLTIAITGDWGAGKSSMMHMLQDDLDNAGFSTLWFNAWHHADDQNLLTALLDGIVREGLPAWYRLQGAVIHLRLLIVRLRQHPVMIATLLGVAAFLAGVSNYGFGRLGNDISLSLESARALSEIHARVDEGKLTVGELCEIPRPESIAGAIAESRRFNCVTGGEDPVSEVQKEAINQVVLAGIRADHGPVAARLTASLTTWFAATLVGAGGLFLLIITVANRVLDSLSLFQGLSGSRYRFLTRGTETDPGLRYRVSRNLEEICSVLPGKRPLAIFIDDVDRCSAEQQLEVLETINFLTENERKRVLVVVGCSVAVTLPSIASCFDETVRVRELANAGQVPLGEEELARKKQDYADHYLRKIFNIEQPCTETVAADTAQAVRAEHRPWVRWVDRYAVSAPLVMAVILGFFYLAHWSIADDEPETHITIASLQTYDLEWVEDEEMYEGEDLNQGELDSGGTGVGDVRTPSVAAAAQPVVSYEPEERLSLENLLMMVLLAGGLLGYHVVSYRYDPVEDSQSFVDMVERLRPVLQFWSPTPRQEGRVINQLRLLAAKCQLSVRERDELAPLRLVILRMMAELLSVPEIKQNGELLTHQEITDLSAALQSATPGDAVLNWAEKQIAARYGSEGSRWFSEQQLKGGAAAAHAIDQAIATEPGYFERLPEMEQYFTAFTAYRFLS